MGEETPHLKFYDVYDLNRNMVDVMKNIIKLRIWRDILVIKENEEKLKAAVLEGT